MLFPYQQTREHELKYLVSSSRLGPILQWLHHMCLPDPKFPRNRISTIYYDTLDRQYFDEKRHSEYQKTKVRVRWYDPVGQSKTREESWLEIKHKIGSQRRKQRFRLPHSQTTLSSLPLEHPIICIDIPRHLPINGIVDRTAIMPMFLLQYDRHRFYEPLHRLRGCVDCHVSVLKVNRQIFPDRRLAPGHLAVLEMKGGVTCLPEPLSQLLKLGCVKTSFSKYGVYYQHLLQEEL